MPGEGLNVIALISGGKDSFFSLLHCIHHGHRVVALANLLPALEGTLPDVQAIDPSSSVARSSSGDGDLPESDLNSFMYQTVGHEIIPLYAAATGLPLYRQPIRGGTGRHERDYAYDAAAGTSDETESMTTLLSQVMRHHPEANAVSAGAILSTYQRIRVESVALRLGLTPLAYLWKYPVLPPPVTPPDDAQLLKDMAAAGLEARIIKVASAGLAEDHLWECVSSVSGAERVKSALRRFGSSGGAVLGEGGEFETVVVNGPSGLFKKCIVVQERRPVQEGGGTTWLMLRDAALQEKGEVSAGEHTVREPDLFDARFKSILDELLDGADYSGPAGWESSSILKALLPAARPARELLQWTVLADKEADCTSIEAETLHVAGKIRHLLSSNSLDASQISNTVVVIRSMADFPKVNAEYGKLFTAPNPPSRVTVSCGNLLPTGRSIAIHLTVDPSPPGNMHRNGLHVQSRSYWAPANIGPYSQAVGIPAGAPDMAASLRTWSVAGQIPLIPSSMELPHPSESSRKEQVVLSLQHLWRIGADLDIQIWTSAVAFFARTSSEEEMRINSEMSRRAWRLAHGSPEEDDEAEDGPDPWDLKHNPKYMNLAGQGQEETRAPLPDWSVMTLRQQNDPETCIPPVFAVEVEELPRQSAVEWHAHIGLSQVEESSTEMLHVGANGWKAWHLVTKSGGGSVWLHTVLARDVKAVGTPSDLDGVQEGEAAAYEDCLRALGVPPAPRARPYLTYIDAVSAGSTWSKATEHHGLAWVPCRSLWGPNGSRLGAISLYRAVLK